MAMIPSLTPVQARLLDHLRQRIAETVSCPTYAKIARDLRLSSKGHVAETIKRLAERGAIVRMPRRPRSIRVVDLPNAARDRVIRAASALMAGLISEDVTDGIATITVRADLLGELDVALAEEG
jgi:SOS-response transcriptional repressor LexA